MGISLSTYNEVVRLIRNFSWQIVAHTQEQFLEILFFLKPADIDLKS